MMITLVVVLRLIVWDADTGKQLDEFRQYFYPGEGGNPIERCRREGVDVGKTLVGHYREKFPNAFANVDCQWEREAI